MEPLFKIQFNTSSILLLKCDPARGITCPTLSAEETKAPVFSSIMRLCFGKRLLRRFQLISPASVCVSPTPPPLIPCCCRLVLQSAASGSSAADAAATGSRFKLDVLKNKARSSLTSSLENIFARVRLLSPVLFFFSPPPPLFAFLRHRPSLKKQEQKYSRFSTLPAATRSFTRLVFLKDVCAA